MASKSGSWVSLWLAVRGTVLLTSLTSPLNRRAKACWRAASVSQRTCSQSTVRAGTPLVITSWSSSSS